MALPQTESRFDVQSYLAKKPKPNATNILPAE